MKKKCYWVLEFFNNEFAMAIHQMCFCQNDQTCHIYKNQWVNVYVYITRLSYHYSFHWWYWYICNTHVNGMCGVVTFQDVFFKLMRLASFVCKPMSFFSGGGGVGVFPTFGKFCVCTIESCSPLLICDILNLVLLSVCLMHQFIHPS